MRVLNFGSVNIDHVYSVEHFVRAGETIRSSGYRKFAGGKGFNQSVALAFAGADVSHAGKIGEDGAWLKEKLEGCGVDASLLEVTSDPTGHAIIQVDPGGENSIVLYGGANQQVTEADAERIPAGFGEGDYLLLQNEISAMPRIISAGCERGLRVVLNPSPMTPQLLSYPLEGVDTFILNEIEGGDITAAGDPEAILAAMRDRYPRAATVLTLGAEGVAYADGETTLRIPAEKVDAVDTTAAGDTFTGYFLAEFLKDRDAAAALKLGCAAAAVCVTRPGAADSIPRREELG